MEKERKSVKQGEREAGTPSVAAPSASDALHRQRAAAHALDAAVVQPMRGDPMLVLSNLGYGVDELLAKAKPADAGWLIELRERGLAFTFAASLVAPAPSDSQVAGLVERAYTVRRLLLASAEALVLAGIVPEAEVAKIRKGRGKIDAAMDCVELSALFVRHAGAVAGRCPVTPAHLHESERVGSQLLQILNPAGAPARAPDSSVNAATDLRDRLYTLVVQGHDRMWRLGASIWGRDEVDRHVPPLGSRVRGKPRAKDAPIAAPPAPHSA